MNESYSINYAKQIASRILFSILIFNFLFAAIAFCEDAPLNSQFLSADKRISFSLPPAWKVIEPNDINMDCIILPDNVSFEAGKQAIVLKVIEPAATFGIDYKTWEGFVRGTISYFVPNTNITVSKAPESSKQDPATEFSADTQDGSSIRGFMCIQTAQHRQMLLYARYPSKQPLGTLECYELIRKTLSVKKKIKTDALNAKLSEAKKKVIIKDLLGFLEGLQGAARSAGQNVSSHNIKGVDIVDNDSTLELRIVVALTDSSTKAIVPAIIKSFVSFRQGCMK